MNENEIEEAYHNIISKIGLANTFKSLIYFCNREVLENWLIYMNKTIKECENENRIK